MARNETEIVQDQHYQQFPQQGYPQPNPYAMPNQYMMPAMAPMGMYGQPGMFPQPPMLPQQFPMMPPIPYMSSPQPTGPMFRPGGGLVSNWWTRVKIGSEFKTTLAENILFEEQERGRKLQREALIAEQLAPFQAQAEYAKIMTRVAIYHEEYRQAQATTREMDMKNALIEEKVKMAMIDRARAEIEMRQLTAGNDNNE